jgi:hypothetical protein
MNLLRILTVVVVFFGIQNTTFAQGNKKKQTKLTYSCPDFREIKWGSNRDSISIDGQKVTLVKASPRIDTAAYIIPDDNMKIGTVILNSILYYFNTNQQFIKVKLLGKAEQLSEMKYILTSKYDAPVVNNIVGGTQFVWSNIDEVKVTMTYYTDLDFFTVEFYSDFDINESKRINKSVSDF